MTGADPFKHLDFNISRHVDNTSKKSGYNIAPIDGYIGGKYTSGVNIYDFNTYSTGLIHDNLDTLSNSLHQDQSEEFFKLLGDEAIGNMIDSAIDMFSAVTGKIGIVVSIGKFTTDAAIQSIEIDINNKVIDEQRRDLTLSDTLFALQILFHF